MHLRRLRHRCGPEGAPRSLSPPLIVAAVCGALVAIGSLGPWAEAFGGLAQKNGVDGDGIITLILGVAAGVGAFLVAQRPVGRTWIGWAVVAAFALCAVVGVYDWADVSSAGAGVSVGWGLPVMTLAAIAGGVAAFIVSMQARRIAS